MERKTASDYPQELLDLFHEYQHGDIDRRAFLDRAGKFAVGGLTVGGDLREPAPQLRLGAAGADGRQTRSRSSVRDREVAAGNGSIKGYLARPRPTARSCRPCSSSTRTAGLNPYIEDVARRLALARFIAFAPDGLTSVGGYPGNDEKGAGRSAPSTARR